MLLSLAGSENQKTSGAVGDQLKEASNINKSLSALGHVILRLEEAQIASSGRSMHVPYRDSRLTFLLKVSYWTNILIIRRHLLDIAKHFVASRTQEPARWGLPPTCPD